jgi:tetratricopeptide (TPR) repeat protein
MSFDNSELEADGACASFGTNRDLFTLPDSSHLGECPICFLPLPIEQKKSTFMSCCSKIICIGCDCANKMREHKAGLEKRCVFCREPVSKSMEDVLKRLTKRVKQNDPDAMREMGYNRSLEGDYQSALKYFTKATELDCAHTHYDLSILYGEGKGVEKDTEKQVYHLEQAAIAGHPTARHNLGCAEATYGRYERATKHFIIAASLGYHDSLNELRGLYADGHASKEEYAGSLRAYQTAVEATKSVQRAKAESMLRSLGALPRRA